MVDLFWISLGGAGRFWDSNGSDGGDWDWIRIKGEIGFKEFVD